MRAGLLIALLTFGAGCSHPCDASSCAAGCCQGDVCYQGTGLTGGRACGSLGGGGGSSSTGGGGANTGGGGGSTGGGTGGGGGCGTLDAPCGSTQPCCQPQPGDNTGYLCNSARGQCDLCGAKDYDCSDIVSSLPCCSGLSCSLKVGSVGVYLCQ